MRAFVNWIGGLVLCSLLTLLVGSVAAEEQISEFQVRSFTAQCVDLLRQDRFDLVARFYHLNPAQKGDQVDLERHQLAAGLARLGKIFGRFDQVRIPEKPQRSHQFEIQGASAAYWKERPHHFQVVYQTRFSRMGEGALVFRVVVYDRRLQLRSIAYALPADSPDSNQRKIEIENEMQTFFQHLQAGKH